MNDPKKIRLALTTLGVVFAALVISFSLDLWGRVEPVRQLPLVDEEFLQPQTWRRSYADLVKKEDEDELLAFSCYECHEEGKKLELTYDKDNHVVVPDEHENIVMGHGSHGRNNDCFNCHNSENLLVLQTRDGHSLKFEESTQLCGSCHGPTHRDWEHGSHGRTSGYWDRSKGEYHKQDCVNCHNPHSPKFPQRAPAPRPNHLRVNPVATAHFGESNTH
ncbi:MAG: hypothetical protein Q8Q59_10235 [Luteolibacter sp.]|nr:hypothetical protein [Luteolibacter sp.]